MSSVPWDHSPENNHNIQTSLKITIYEFDDSLSSSNSPMGLIRSSFKKALLNNAFERNHDNGSLFIGDLFLEPMNLARTPS